jgi:hypothetical protein
MGNSEGVYLTSQLERDFIQIELFRQSPERLIDLLGAMVSNLQLMSGRLFARMQRLQPVSHWDTRHLAVDLEVSIRGAGVRHFPRQAESALGKAPERRCLGH